MSDLRFLAWTSRLAARAGERTPLLAVALCLFTTPVPAPAQTTTGSLQGRVVTEDGAALAGVTAVATGPNLQGSRERLSDASGFFQLLGLPPGPYTVRLSRLGLRPVVVEEVPVALGGASGLGDIVLEREPLDLVPIVVRASELVIDPVHTTAGATLETADYAVLPGQRDYKSVITILPHVNESYRGDVANAGGQTGPESAYFIDGMNATSPLWGGADATSLPYNFIRAVEVKTGGYEAQYGKALGAVVNAVTYSGTNDFEAAVFGFGTTSALAAESRTGTSFRTDGFWSYDVGVRVSGPVVRDRLWYSAAYNPSIRDAEVEIAGHGLFDDREVNHRFAGKLTWQATRPLNLELSILGDPGSHDYVGWAYIPFDLDVAEPESFLLRAETGGVTGSLRARAVVGSRWLLEGSVVAASGRDRQIRRPEVEDAGAYLVDYVTGMLSGGPALEATYDMGRLSISGRATATLGRHTVSVGGDYEVVTLDHSLDGRLIQRFDWGYWDWRESLQGTTGSRMPTAWLQDSWRPVDRLTLNAGLRWSSQYLIGYDGEVAQRFLHEWQPRLGFVLQLGRPGTQRVFGSYGRYYQSEPGYLATIQYNPSRVLLLGCPADPWQSEDGCAVFREETTNPRERYDLPGDLEVDNLGELTLGYELSLGTGATVGLRGIHRALRSAFGWGADYDSETGDIRDVMGTPGRGDFDFLPSPEREYTALELTLRGQRGAWDYRGSYVLSRSRGNYTGFFAADHGVTKPGGNGMFAVPQHAENSRGLLPNDRTHVLKFATSYATRLGLTAGALVTWMSGTPLNELGVAGPSTLNNLWEVLLVPRGSVGRTPDLWNLDLRVAYATTCPGGGECRLILDALHVGNPQRPTWLDEFHYRDMDLEGNQIQENPGYLQPIAHQPPMMLRVGLEVGW